MTTPDDANDSTQPTDIDPALIDSDTFEQWVLAIARFDEVFVRSGTRSIMDKGNPLQWFPYPNGFQSRGYNALRDDFEPLMVMAVYGCFVNLVKLSTDPPRYGVLAHSDGQPYKLSMINRITGAPPDLIITTIRWCVRIGWMTATPIAPESRISTAAVSLQQCRGAAAAVPQHHCGAAAARQEETQHKKTQHKEIQRKGRSPPAVAECVPPPTNSAPHQKPKRPPFQKPTVAEVSQYVLEIDATVDARQFVDYYESNGWLVGRAAMRDWKATVRNWESRNQKGNHYAHNTTRAARGNKAAIREQANADSWDILEAAASASGCSEGIATAETDPNAIGCIEERCSTDTVRP